MDYDNPRDVHLDQPPITPHSCKHCQRVVLRREHFTKLQSSRVELPHTVNEIRQALRDKCELILLFASAESPAHVLFCSGCSECEDPRAQNLNKMAMLKYAPNRSTNWFSDPWKIGSYFYRLRSLCTLGPFSMILEKDESRNFSLRFNDSSWLQPTHLLSRGVEVKAKGVTEEAAVELGSIIAECYNADVASDSSLAQMYQWLTECHSTHTLCQQEPFDFTPRRLLHLDFSKDDSLIRLVEDFQGRQIKWAALSYVWGGEQSFKTTLNSLPDMERGFRPEVLPQTLRDAVRVCKAMSLHYLWVDSLCIVQDDPGELSHELATMPLIYQRAWVTISASTAACMSDGFLQNRCYSHWGGCRNNRVPISLPFLADDNFGTGKIVFVHASDACLNKAEPINERAWTYQERRLSPRVLDFRYNQVVLCCYTNKRCQGDGSNVSWRDRGSESLSLEDLILWDIWYPETLQAYRYRHRNSPQYERLYRPCLANQKLPKWHEIVNAYATRKSSLPSDKLIALSALADIYRKQTGHKYCAGLWEESVVRDLLWRNPGNTLLPRPKVYRAPSWSWAAVDLVAPGMHSTLNKMHDPFCIYEEEPDTAALPLAKIIDVEIRQEPPNTTFGMIYAGLLTIEAPVLWTKCCETRWGMGIVLDGRYARVYPDANEDDDIGGSSAEPAVLAVLLTRSASVSGLKPHLYYGLVLYPTSEGSYRRTGMIRTYSDQSHLRGEDVHPDYDTYFRSLFNIQTITIV